MKLFTITTISILMCSVLFTACSNKQDMKKAAIQKVKKMDKQKIKEAFQELNNELKK